MYRAERHDTVEQPQVFGRFHIRGVLGEGGMGRLYVAEQTGIEGFAKIVALKRILPHLADSPHFRSLFLNEARVAARLEHPNIVTTYELGEVDGTYYIAMEYLPGEDLSAILSRCAATSPMPLEIAAALAHQSANGLHYAHELRDPTGKPAGLVHRDVNPSNIFVTYYGMAKLLDFGIVKASSDSTKTSPGVFKGKYAYSAPEQIQGDPVDQRTDVFCLGIVLWECLTGRRLFEAPTDAATIDAVRTRLIAPPSRTRPEVPAELEDITMRALVRDPKGRFQSAQEMSEALDRFVARRAQRSSSKGVGQWMESLFGAERASMKKAIAQGTDVENALATLTAKPDDAAKSVAGDRPGSVRGRSVVRPRALWSLSSGGGTAARATAPKSVVTHPVTTVDGPVPEPVASPPRLPASPSGTVIPLSMPAPPARPGGRRVIVASTVALVVSAAVVIAVMGTRSPSAEVAVEAIGSLDIQSEPGGAHVIVDGDPSGLVTPAVLRGLRAGRVVEVRLDKAGYAPVIQKLTVQAGATKPHQFKLSSADGVVRLKGIPPRAQVFLDDNAIDAQKPFSASVGSHKLRVETESELFFSETIEIKPGEQTVQLRASRRTP